MKRREQPETVLDGVALPAELADFAPEDWPKERRNDLGDPYMKWIRARNDWARAHGLDPRDLPGRIGAKERMRRMGMLKEPDDGPA